MRSVDILFERANRNREKYIKSVEEIGRAAQARIIALYVYAKYSERNNTFVLIVSNGEGSVLIVDAMDFFDRFGNKKGITKQQLKKCKIYECG